MEKHLTDIACLEWIRHRKIALAPETTFGVETHLSSCADCRDKLADFEELERSFNPYGAPMPQPAALRVGKAAKALGIVLAVALAVLLVVALT